MSKERNKKGQENKAHTQRLVDACGGDARTALRRILQTMKASHYEFIREFCVVDMKGVRGMEDATSVLFYVPELASRTLDLAYELVVSQVQEKPEDDIKLMEFILLGQHRAEETPEDTRLKSHAEGVKLIEKLCRDFGSDVGQMARVGNFTRYEKVRNWYVVDVRNLNVQGSTMIVAVPSAEWVLSETPFDPVLDAMAEADDDLMSDF
jgi:hypothetical protein